ncbi:MAG: cob(I)yrinic acid a,c-diamide adenosyltransferase [Peptococcaceae bacterium]|nr:cob(I)yrinic acid a,c-diamide adenosyltransferase [Peptococcaceae bacterium]
MMYQGLIHIYCGDGKGKTTASLGLAVRCAGRGFKVLIIQFLKNQDTGELHSLERIPEITILRSKGNYGFLNKMTEEQKKQCRIEHDNNLAQGIALGNAGQIDLLILDEVIAAFNHDMVDRHLLLDFLKNKPLKLEIVLNGREPDHELTELADYVSEIKKIKHPYDKGIQSRIGIER